MKQTQSSVLRLAVFGTWFCKKSAFTLAALRHVLGRREVALLFAVYFMFFVSFVFLQAVIPPWLQRLFGFGALETSFLFAYIGVVSVLTQGFVLPRLSRMRSNVTLAFYGIVLLTVGLLALGTLPYLALLIIVGALVAMGFGIGLTTLSTLISLTAPKEAQGGSLGIAWSLAALAQTIGPTLATFFFAVGVSIGWAGFAFILAAGITLSTIPLLVNLRKHEATET
jgi:DHA1 family tetracycline resistance protein-like MFS transporter